MLYKVLKNNLFFLIPYAITLLAAGCVLAVYSKPDIHIWLNGHNSGFFDWVFRHVTFLGDGLFVICIAVLLLFYSLRSSVFLLTAYLSTGLVVQILKRIVFADYQRPVKYFHDTVQLHLVDGVRLLNGHSFPSGHSASAFALFLSLAIFSRNRLIQVICFILACMVAYSRVYLSQHFLVDILAGSLIGAIGTIALYPAFYRKRPEMASMVADKIRERMNKANDRSPSLYYAGIFIISALLFIPFLGQVHLFDWDEINFAESAREMIASHDYLTVKINFIPFWEKPPLFIWMQVISMKIFGINEFAARFPNALCGIITLFVLFRTGNKIADKKFAVNWVVLYGGSILPFIYFKSGIIDPWFNLFIFLGIYQCYLYVISDKNRTLKLAGSALFIGLAILTKGPVALLVFLLSAGIYLDYP